MNSFLQNKELKLIITKLLAAQVIFSIIIFGFINYKMVSLNREIVNQNSALIGKIANIYTNIGDKLVPLITKKASASDINRGNKILKQYGYSIEMSVSSQPVLRNFYMGFSIMGAFLLILFFIPIGILILLSYKDIYAKVRKISAAAEGVVEGNFDIRMPEKGEGDFDMLGHNFNAMAYRLKLSIEKLREEKVFLKNTISDISHQLKTPLTSLITINELLLAQKNMGEEIRFDFLEKSKSQLNRVEWLIINLLKMARLESGNIVFKIERALLHNIIENALHPLIIKAEEKHLRIGVTGEINNVFFSGDEEWTAEALTNIVKNCIEHTPEYGEINIELVETPIFSKVVITDTGEGIDKNDIPHIFERFYKGSNAAKTESVGIGLALAKVIIEGQNGTISVLSEKGKGSKFIITFLKGSI